MEYRHIKWSKRKKMLESFLCKTLKGRIEYHCTRYRHAHDAQGRVWITLDKKEIFSMSFSDCAQYHYWKIDDETLTPNEKIDIMEEKLHSEGIHCPHDFGVAFSEYFSSKIEDALQSKELLTRALVAFDYRLGKRRLEDLRTNLQEMPEWLQGFYIIRFKAE